MTEDLLEFLFTDPWGWVILGVIAFIAFIGWASTLEDEEEEEDVRAKIEAEIRAEDRRKKQRERRKKKAAEDKLKREELKAKQAEELLSYMPTKLSQLTPLVSKVIKDYDFSECHDSIQLLSPSEAQTVLRDYSEDCEDDYRRAIKEFIESGYSTNPFPHRKEEIREKYKQLTEKSVEIGARAIAKQIGYAYKETDLPPTQADGKKRGSALRKTKKWKDD